MLTPLNQLVDQLTQPSRLSISSNVAVKSIPICINPTFKLGEPFSSKKVFVVFSLAGLQRSLDTHSRELENMVSTIDDTSSPRGERISIVIPQDLHD